MCGCTLLLGSPHKNSDLRQCSMRQPTVYSYTASHRSPCIRVDSPTQFHLHQHHDHYHPDSQFNNIFNNVATKYAYKKYQLQGPHDHKQLLCQLGLWFAYYCDKMIGHAKIWVQLSGKNRYQGDLLIMHKIKRGKWVFIDMINGGLLALLTRFYNEVFNEGGGLRFWLHLYSIANKANKVIIKRQCIIT